MKFENAAFSEPEKFENEGKTIIRKPKITAENFPDPEIAEPRTREDELLEYYDPKRMEAGIENIVFGTKANEDVVIKVSGMVTREIVHNAMREGLHINEISEKKKEEILERIKADKERQRTLKNFFGKEHILPSRASLKKVPVSKEMLEEMLKRKLPREVPSLWTIVTVQKRSRGLSPEVPDEQKFSLTASYPEASEHRPEAYDEVTKAFVLNPDSSNGSGVSPEMFALIEKNEQLQVLISMASENKNLKATLQDFITKAIAYSDATGEIIDVAGKNNVTLFQENGKWNYEFIDHLHPDKNILTHTREILAKKDEELTDYEKSIVVNAVHYIRFINGLATFLDVPQRIQLLAQAKNKHPDFYEMLQGLE